MAVNKVVYNNENGAQTLIDLTNDSVTPETLAKGVTAHDASGERIVGTLDAKSDTMVGTWEINDDFDASMLEGEYAIKATKADLPDVEIIGISTTNGFELYLVTAEGEETWYGTEWMLDRTFDIIEEPEDPIIRDWIKANAKKQADKNDSSNFEMPIIRFANFQDTDGSLCLSEENPFKFTVEVLGGGALQEGDKLQICVRRKYKWKSEGRSKWRLRQVVERDITSEDIGKRFLSIDVRLDEVEGRGYWLFRNDRKKSFYSQGNAIIDSLSYMYFRIKRITKYNGDGEECDAIFSNIEKVAKTYTFTDQRLTIK